MRHEDDRANNRRRDRCQQDRARADILRAADAFALLEGYLIGEELDSGVHRLGDPDQRHREKKKAPLDPVQMDKDSEGHHANRGDEMNHRIRLGAYHHADAAKSIAETARALAEIEGHAAQWRSSFFPSSFPCREQAQIMSPTVRAKLMPQLIH